MCVCSSFYTELFLKVVADIGYEYLTFDLFLRFQIPGTLTSIFGGWKPSRVSWRLEGNVIYTRNASRWLQKSPAGVNKRGKSWRDRRARRMMRKLWYINRFGDYALRSQLLPRKFAIRTCLSDTSNEFPYRILNGFMGVFYQGIYQDACAYLQLKFQMSDLVFLYMTVNNILLLYKKM